MSVGGPRHGRQVGRSAGAPTGVGIPLSKHRAVPDATKLAEMWR